MPSTGNILTEAVKKLGCSAIKKPAEDAEEAEVCFPESEGQAIFELSQVPLLLNHSSTLKCQVRDEDPCLSPCQHVQGPGFNSQHYKTNRRQERAEA